MAMSYAAPFGAVAPKAGKASVTKYEAVRSTAAGSGMEASTRASDPNVMPPTSSSIANRGVSSVIPSASPIGPASSMAVSASSIAPAIGVFASASGVFRKLSSAGFIRSCTSPTKSDTSASTMKPRKPSQSVLSPKPPKITETPPSCVTSISDGAMAWGSS